MGFVSDVVTLRWLPGMTSQKKRTSNPNRRNRPPQRRQSTRTRQSSTKTYRPTTSTAYDMDTTDTYDADVDTGDTTSVATTTVSGYSAGRTGSRLPRTTQGGRCKSCAGNSEPNPYYTTGATTVDVADNSQPDSVDRMMMRCGANSAGMAELPVGRNRMCVEDYPRVYAQHGCTAMAPGQGPNAPTRDTTYGYPLRCNTNRDKHYAFIPPSEQFPEGAAEAFNKQLDASEGSFEDGHFEVVDTSHDDAPIKGVDGYYDCPSCERM